MIDARDPRCVLDVIHEAADRGAPIVPTSARLSSQGSSEAVSCRPELLAGGRALLVGFPQFGASRSLIVVWHSRVIRDAQHTAVLREYLERLVGPVEGVVRRCLACRVRVENRRLLRFDGIEMWPASLSPTRHDRGDRKSRTCEFTRH